MHFELDNSTLAQMNAQTVYAADLKARIYAEGCVVGR